MTFHLRWRAITWYRAQFLVQWVTLWCWWLLTRPLAGWFTWALYAAMGAALLIMLVNEYWMGRLRRTFGHDLTLAQLRSLMAVLRHRSEDK